MSSSWERMSLVIDRYENIANKDMIELKKQQRVVLENGGERDSRHVRNMVSQYEDQLLQGLQQMLQQRSKIDENYHELFDQRIEPIRRQIQTCLNVGKSFPPLDSTNPFLEEDTADDDNPYEAESRRYLKEKSIKETEMQQIAEEAKQKAEATRKIQAEMEDLEQIFSELAKIVHEQHDAVDSIEEQVERATEDVKRGNEQLKKAVQSKAAKTPLVAGVVGGLVVGGPVGLTAGSAIAGIAAGVGGLVAGLYTGRFFKKSATQQ